MNSPEITPPLVAIQSIPLALDRVWYRDVEIEKSDDALREGSLHVLWAAELIGSTKNFGQALRRRMALRLKANSFNAEATLALRWLNQRGRPE